MEMYMLWNEEDEIMDKFLDVLKQIRKRPHLYIGSRSLDRLDLFITGYLMCQSTDTPHRSSIDIVWKAFDDFVHKKYNTVLTISMAMIIAENSPDDEIAFDTFFELLDEFLEEYGGDRRGGAGSDDRAERDICGGDI